MRISDWSSDVCSSDLEQVVVDQGTLQAEETVVPATDAGTGDIAPPAGPVAGVRLQYADAPSPPYPRAALRAGLQGTVMLQVLVDVDGRPLQVDVEHSSGHRVLDNAARRYVLQNWTFRPAMRGGRPVQAVGLVPRSEEHTSELQSLMRISDAVFCLKKKTYIKLCVITTPRHYEIQQG